MRESDRVREELVQREEQHRETGETVEAGIDGLLSQPLAEKLVETMKVFALRFVPCPIHPS